MLDRHLHIARHLQAGANTSGLHWSDRSLKVIPVHPLDAWQARTPEALRSKVPTVALTVLLVLLSEGDCGVPLHVPPEVVPQSVESVPGEQRLPGTPGGGMSHSPLFAYTHESSLAHSHPATARQEAAELSCSLT